jgi:hypothetical protein
MVSKKQLEANKNNALKSTGPINTTKTRFNATKHGLLSKEVIYDNPLLKENKKEYFEFVQEMINDYQPETKAQLILIEEFCNVCWKKKRFELMNNAIFSKDTKRRIEHLHNKEKFDRYKLEEDLINQPIENLQKLISKMKEENEEDIQTLEFIEILLEVKIKVLDDEVENEKKSNLISYKTLEDNFQKYLNNLDRRFLVLYKRLEEMRFRRPNLNNSVLIQSEKTFIDNDFHKRTQ